MPITIYDASVPAFTAALRNLSHVLEKGEAFGATAGLPAEELLDARLAPDMHPLQRQVQILSDNVKGAAARLAGVAIPSYADDEASFADLQARLTKTRKFVNSLPKEAFEGAETRPITLPNRPDANFNGQTYLFGFALPNIHFHLTTAYAILRMKGVPLGKKDFFGAR